MTFHDETVVKHNFSNHMVYTALHSLGMSLIPTTLIQDYILVELGLGYDMIGLYSTAGTVIISLMMFLLPGLADSVKTFSSFRRALFLISLACCFPPLALLSVHALGLSGTTLAPLLAFALILGAYVAFSAVVSGISPSFDPKMMVRLGFTGSGIMRLMGVQGLLGDSASIIGSLLVSAVIAAALDHYLWLPVFAIAFLLISGLFRLRYRPLSTDADTCSTTTSHSPIKAFRQVFPMREFRLLLLPNALRGVADSIWAFMVPVALLKFEAHPLTVAVFTVIGPLGNGLGNLLMTAMKRQPNLGRTYQLTSAISGAALVLSCFADNLYLYAALYAVTGICFLLYGNMPMFFTYKYVPSHVLGSYTALRLFVLNLFSAVIGYITGVVLELDIPFLALSVTALVMFLISGVLFRRSCDVLDKGPAST